MSVLSTVSAGVSFIQAMTLLIGVFSQTDFQDSLNTLLIGYHKEELKANFVIPGGGAFGEENHETIAWFEDIKQTDEGIKFRFHPISFNTP